MTVLKNLITNKYVALTHTDNGMWNGDGNLADFDFPTPGIVETHPGYKDCAWSPGEWLTFKEEVVSSGNDVPEEESTFMLELSYSAEMVQEYRKDLCSSIVTYDRTQPYSKNTCVYYCIIILDYY